VVKIRIPPHLRFILIPLIGSKDGESQRTHGNRPLNIDNAIENFYGWWLGIKEEFFKFDKDPVYSNRDLTRLSNEMLRIFKKEHKTQLNTLQITNEIENELEKRILFINQFHDYYEPNSGYSLQEQIWNEISKDDPELITNAFQEQKEKYGTTEFTNTKMLRALTEYTKNQYQKFITEKLETFQAPQGMKISLVGMGFGGVAFKIEYPGHGSFVLKFPLTKKTSKTSFGNLERDYKGLFELEKLHEGEDFSQKLYYVKQANKYLIPEDKRSEMLATEFVHGTNLLTLAARQLQNYRENRDPGKEAKAFFEYGITDENLFELAKYHQELCQKQISFYDLFPHNIIYDYKRQTKIVQNADNAQSEDIVIKGTEVDLEPTKKAITEYEGVFKFIDSVTQVIGKCPENDIKVARRDYSIDSLVFDLVSFLVLQEQTHPYTVSLRRAARTYFMKTQNQDSIENAYENFKQKRFQQIQRVLERLITQNLINKQDLLQALGRLIKHFENTEDHPAKAFHKDFSRITKKGIEFIKSLENHFEDT